MPDKKNTLINMFIISLLVGLIVAIVQLALPKFFEKDVELSYLLDEPKVNLDQNTIGEINVKINNIETSLLVTQSARIWNSGEIPIKMLPIRYVFETPSPKFKIFTVNHNTKLKYEFGKITLEEDNQYSKRFVYDLLNPNDEFTIIFLTNEIAPLRLYTKCEGLSIKLFKLPERNLSSWIIIFASFFSAVLSLTLYIFKDFFFFYKYKKK